MLRILPKLKINAVKPNPFFLFSENKTAIDYYNCLNVKPGCSEDDIKSAYLEMVKKYHPDLNRDPQAADKFRSIQEAYDYLMDPKNRKI